MKGGKGGEGLPGRRGIPGKMVSSVYKLYALYSILGLVFTSLVMLCRVQKVELERKECRLVDVTFCEDIFSRFVVLCLYLLRVWKGPLDRKEIQEEWDREDCQENRYVLWQYKCC